MAQFHFSGSYSVDYTNVLRNFFTTLHKIFRASRKSEEIATVVIRCGAEAADPPPFRRDTVLLSAVSAEVSFFPLAGGALGQGGVDFRVVGVFAETGIDRALEITRRFDVVFVVGLDEDDFAAGPFHAEK